MTPAQEQQNASQKEFLIHRVNLRNRLETSNSAFEIASRQGEKIAILWTVATETLTMQHRAVTSRDFSKFNGPKRARG